MDALDQCLKWQTADDVLEVPGRESANADAHVLRQCLEYLDQFADRH